MIGTTRGAFGGRLQARSSMSKLVKRDLAAPYVFWHVLERISVLYAIRYAIRSLLERIGNPCRELGGALRPRPRRRAALVTATRRSNRQSCRVGGASPAAGPAAALRDELSQGGAAPVPAIASTPCPDLFAASPTMH
jgi:hypothetical protein